MQVIKAHVRDSILQSAEKEFARQGYSSASIRSIAENAGTSAGNLYKYFPGKEQLFLAVVMPTADECIGMVERTFTFSDESLSQSAGFMADYVSRHRDIFKALTSGPTEHYTSFLNRFTEVISRKLKEYAYVSATSAVQKINNPSFFDAIASSYVGGLSKIMEQFMDREEAESYLRELTEFMFLGFRGRLELIVSGG